MKKLLEDKINQLYKAMVRNSRKRKHNPPCFSISEFKEWITSQPRFENIIKNWVDSSFNTYLAPSVDRIDDNVGYMFSNMQLVTWVENMEKSHNDRSHEVYVYDIKGNLVKKVSNSFAASLFTKDSPFVVRNNCKGVSKLSSCGYQYKYVGSNKQITDLSNNPDLKICNFPVYMVSKKGEIVKRFNSISKALKFLDIDPKRTNKISNICKQGVGIFQGYRWCFADDESYKQLLDNIPSSVIQYDLEGNFVSEYFSVTEAGKITEISGIREVLDAPNKSRGGFQWRTKDSDVEVGVYDREENIIYKKVYQFTKQGEFIAEYESLKKVVEKFGGRKKGYEKAMYGEKPSYKGFKWSRNKSLSPT